MDAAGLLLAASNTQQKASPAISVPAPVPDRDLLSHKQHPPEIASVLAVTHPSLITRQWVIKGLLDLQSLPQLPRSVSHSLHTLAAFLFPALKGLWLCIITLQLGHTPTRDEGMQVQERELQHVLEGLGQAGIGCAPKCTDSLSLIFQVYQIMGHAYNCASAWAPAILETSP